MRKLHKKVSDVFCYRSYQVTKSNTNPDDLGGLANELTNEFGNLANEAKYAAMTAENDEVSQVINALPVLCTIFISHSHALHWSFLSPDWLTH